MQRPGERDRTGLTLEHSVSESFLVCRWIDIYSRSPLANDNRHCTGRRKALQSQEQASEPQARVPETQLTCGIEDQQAVSLISTSRTNTKTPLIPYLSISPSQPFYNPAPIIIFPLSPTISSPLSNSMSSAPPSPTSVSSLSFKTSPTNAP